ncbi:MAG: hypothetical protein AAGH64_03405, partial [Planctomycetota bacterium]
LSMSRRLPFADPDPAGSERARIAKATRDLATEISRLTPQALTRSNGEETDHNAPFPANFTKGLIHNSHGVLDAPEHYRAFVEAINSSDRTLFERSVTTAESLFGDDPSWRGWESPRSGHVYELQGPDAGAVGMAPAPRINSSELAVEMAEVYALAILRDVPFEEIRKGGGTRIDGTQAESDANALSEAISDMEFFGGKGSKKRSSTPHQTDASGLNRFERDRRDARLIGGAIEPKTIFRGSTPGSFAGPYVSQFMLVGARSRAGDSGTAPGATAGFEFTDGLIPYGTLVIDQRTQTHKQCLDYMTDWKSWLDVQNGGDLRGRDSYEGERRFITTPRDLATYVHFDALYEAYLNAGLIMLAMGVPFSKGFPEPSPSGARTPFATFGGPHILSLVTEIATRCLKAVRRQKFNYHRRARPEALGGRFTLIELGKRFAAQLGCAEDAFRFAHDQIPGAIRKAIIAHNAEQNAKHERDIDDMLPEGLEGEVFEDANLLLPMAFPEGSPMHPAYGAGHATVAGGCVTMLKAFFEMFEDCDSGAERELVFPDEDKKPPKDRVHAYVPNSDGTALKVDKKTKKPLTIQGELDKLAANISIGRNMAGVHYYSDYYDSVRMGERIAVGLLLEQAPTYGDIVEMTFTSFDGDHISITGEAGSCPSLSVLDSDGNPIAPQQWWLRHVSGQEFSEDL